MFRHQSDERIEFELDRLQVATGQIYNFSLGELDEAELSRQLRNLGLPDGLDRELLGFLCGVFMGIGWTIGVFQTYRRSSDDPWFSS